MNKEKVIAWLENLIEQASQSDKYFIERNELFTENKNLKKMIEIYTGVDRENEKLKEENQQLKEIEKEHQKINGELMTRINKAIEYMEENSFDTWNSDNTKLLYRLANVDNTIEILKGVKDE